MTVEANLFDLQRLGGFVAQEEILLTNLEKLGYELDELIRVSGGLFQHKIERILEISASIATVVGVFRGDV